MGDVRVDVLTLGTIRVRRAHAELRGPAALRYVRIAVDLRRAPAVPVNCYLVRVGDLVLLADTGEQPGAVEPGYYRGDPVLHLLQRAGFTRMDLPPEDALVPQLERLGVAPADVTHVALSHLHFDHAGTLAPFEGAEVLVADREVRAQSGPAPLGAHRAAWPSWFPDRATRVTHDDGPVGPFARSHVVDAAGRVRLVPTPGHSPGHQSLVVLDDDRAWVFAGDATFSLDQLRDGGLPGITFDVGRARRSNDHLRELVDERRAVYLPAHDPDAAARVTAALDG